MWHFVALSLASNLLGQLRFNVSINIDSPYDDSPSKSSTSKATLA